MYIYTAYIMLEFEVAWQWEWCRGLWEGSCGGHQGRQGRTPSCSVHRERKRDVHLLVSLHVPSGAQGRRLEWAKSLLELVFFFFIEFAKSRSFLLRLTLLNRPGNETE